MKKYVLIDSDIDGATNLIEKGVFIGNEVNNLGLPEGEHVYKARIPNSSAGVGTLNGFRIVYYVVEQDSEVYLLTIYSKKDQENITNKEIKALIKNICGK